MSPAKWTLISIALLAACISPRISFCQQITPPEPTTMPDLCQVTIDAGLLKFDSKLPGENYPTKTFIFPADPDATITVRFFRPLGADFGQFTLRQDKTIDGVPTLDSIEYSANHITIYRRTNGQGPDQHRRISLAQVITAKGEAIAPGPHSTFVFKVYDTSIEPPTVLLTVRGETYDELRQADPEVAETYLRPVLESLELEQLLSPPTMMAMQVFNEQYPIDPEVKAKVEPLVQQLNADWAPDRDAASTALAALGDPATLVLLKEDRKLLTSEQISRIDKLCGQAQPLTAEQIANLRRDPRFLLDCLDSPHRPVRQAAFKALREATGKEIAFDIDGDEKDRVIAKRDLKARLLAPTTRP